MKIAELTVNQGNVEVEGIVKEVGEIREFNKYGKILKVANAILQDDSGSIKLTLWNDDAENYNEGDKVKILNGYVNEFQGEMQLTSGKFGKIERIGEPAPGKESLDADSEYLEDAPMGGDANEEIEEETF